MPFPTSFSRISLPDGKTSSSQDRKGKAPALRTIQPPEDIAMEDCVIWYIGEEGRSLVNMQMTHANLPVSHSVRFDMETQLIHSASCMLILRQRKLLKRYIPRPLVYFHVDYSPYIKPCLPMSSV